jgi:hypothetical protein
MKNNKVEFSGVTAKQLLTGLFLMLSLVLSALEIRVAPGLNCNGKFSYSIGQFSIGSKMGESPTIAMQAVRLKNNITLGLGAEWHNVITDVPILFSDIEDSKLGCLPIYVTSSYRFPTSSSVQPEFVAQLGCSINDIKQETKNTPNYTVITAKNGLYYGLGLGLLYKQYSLNMMYRVTELPYVSIRYRNNIVDYKNDNDGKVSQINVSLGYRIRD